MNLRSIVNFAIAGSCAALLAGCASYYQVRDPGTGQTYYTSNVDTPGSAGTVRFKDDRTQRQITLQNSEVRQVSREEYDRGLNTPPQSTVITPAPSTVIIK
jgi:hypothetical protein